MGKLTTLTLLTMTAGLYSPEKVSNGMPTIYLDENILLYLSGGLLTRLAGAEECTHCHNNEDHDGKNDHAAGICRSQNGSWNRC
jgi:hypothetical protein